MHGDIRNKSVQVDSDLDRIGKTIKKHGGDSAVCRASVRLRSAATYFRKRV
jgi:hypothetical protein